jgi:hypothetical protein
MLQHVLDKMETEFIHNKIYDLQPEQTVTSVYVLYYDHIPTHEHAAIESTWNSTAHIYI